MLSGRRPVVLFLLLTLVPAISARSQSASELIGRYSTQKFALELNANGKYRRTWGDCTTESYEQGTYTLSERMVSLVVQRRGVRQRGDHRWQNLLDARINEKFNGDDAPWPTRWELFAVRWGTRLYLMEKDSFVDFANAINFGLEPRAGAACDWPVGGFYLRDGDGNKRVTGSPSLPNDVLKMVLDKPVAAEIVAIERDGETEVAILNQGTDAGLRTGMRLLRDSGQPKFWGGMQIISTTDHSARLSLDEQARVGDKLISRFERVRILVKVNQE